VGQGLRSQPFVPLKSLTYPLPQSSLLLPPGWQQNILSFTFGPVPFFPLPTTVCISPISTQIRIPPPRPTSAPHATNTSQTRARSRFPTAPVNTRSQLYHTRTSVDTRHVLYSGPLFMLSKPKQPAHHLKPRWNPPRGISLRRISLIGITAERIYGIAYHISSSPYYSEDMHTKYTLTLPGLGYYSKES
jgi:hypothetical protein